MESFKLFVEGLSDQTEHEVLNMYYSRGDYRISDISDHTGVSTGTIYRILQKHNITPTRRSHTPDQYETIYHFSDTGIPARRIAELTGYSLRHVYNILNARDRSQPASLDNNEPFPPGVVPEQIPFQTY